MVIADYVFKGKHGSIVTQLVTEINSDNIKFRFFKRNIDIYLLAPVVGYLYGRMAERDNSPDNLQDNVKKINYQQMATNFQTIKFNYSLIMLLHEKDHIEIEKRLDRAFRYTEKDPEAGECDEIFEKYLLGGVEVLKEKLLDNASTIDEYISNMYNFVTDYNERYNLEMNDKEILDLCK